MIHSLRATAAKGRWNEDRSSWTTVDGRYKIVRRSQAPGVSAAWIFYATPNAAGTPFVRFGEARRFLQETINASSTPTLKSVKDTGK